MSVDDEAAGVGIPVTKEVETETDGVTEAVVARGVVTEDVTVRNRVTSSLGSAPLLTFTSSVSTRLASTP